MIPVFYGTTRRSTSREPDPQRFGEFYGSERDELQYGICNVSIPEGHKPGEIERPFELGPISFREDPTEHVVILSLEPTDEATFFTRLKGATAGEKDAFLFVHGYNVSELYQESV